MRYLYTALLLLITTLAVAQSSVDNALTELDGKINERYLYKVEKDRRINSLKFDLSNSADPLKRSSLSHDLFEAYKTYQYDSAYLYALRCREFAVQCDNSEMEALSLCDLLYCYSTAGFFKEGAEIIADLDTTSLSDQLLVDFYRGCIRYYFNLMRYVDITDDLAATYRVEMLHYTSLALDRLREDSFNYRFLAVQSDVLLGVSPQVNVSKLEDLLSTPNLSLNNKAIIYSWLGMVYDLLEERDEAIYYTALSAIADIESCTYETTSAKVLAEYMFDVGDIDRAARYIHMALYDANTYNSPYRKLEIQAILPRIADKRFYLIQKDKRFLTIITSLFVLLLLLIVYMLIKIHGRNAALRIARGEVERRAGELAEVNDQLSTLNVELSEANQIKDRYIIESLYSDSEFVDNVESMCKVLMRKIKAKQFTDLEASITGLGIKQERQRMSSTFDSAFLKLFPNFVAEYNKLFDAESSVMLGESGELTPEMRIFALIRLGIEDVNLISRYLNLSLNTVYVYKAKVKARTIVPKEEFEEYIKAIKQPY